MEVLHRNHDAPLINVSSELSGYVAEFDVAQYSHFLSGFVSESEIGNLKINFETRSDDDKKAGRSKDDYLDYGDHFEREICIYLDSIADHSRDHQEFVSVCHRTLMHETGHYIDYCSNQGEGIWLEHNVIEAVTAVSSAAVALCGLSEFCRQMYKWRSKGEFSERAVLSSITLGAGSATTAYFINQVFPLTRYYYENFNAREHFACAFEDFHKDHDLFLDIQLSKTGKDLEAVS